MIAALVREMVFRPLLPLWLLAAATLVSALPLALSLLRRAPGTLWRALACAIALLWLAGPRQIIRTGTPLPDIALLVVDRSASMQVSNRAALAEAAAQRLTAEAAARPDLQLRRVDVPEAGTGGTKLFAAIDAALADIPPDQRAGVIALTDGAVSDAPPRFDLPLHALIPARGEQTDRRLRILSAPGYGVVGQPVQIVVAVDDLGPHAGSGPAQLSWSQDGVPAGQMDVTPGQPTTIDVPITRGGKTILALTASPLPGEASLLNNRAALTINGVRDRLRVLLISGEPHAGERTWRRLLKADPAVDLVHFTILRPPGKTDATPLSQLALIAFPIRELFVDKIRQFDLIILDRFADPGILPPSYLENIANYVRQGGALLVSAGPEFASAASIAHGPIGDILPAQPLDGDDAVVTGAFRPVVTKLGERHPVTENLPGDVPDGTPHWGDWYRRIATGPADGDTVLQASPGGPPLLVLNHVGDGRVALLLSDQIWLWSRGHEGGGPQAELLRRVAHWLMAEPDLDENALDATVANGRLTVARHGTTPEDPAAKMIVTDPDGQHTAYTPTTDETLSIPATAPGLWQLQYGAQHAYAAASPDDIAEYADLRATAERLRPIASSVHWLTPDGPPDLAALQLRHNQAMHLTGIETQPLLPNAVILPLLLALLGLSWWREGR